jgi:hypothetical protein
VINEYPINHKTINVSGPWTTSDETWYGGVSGTLKNYPETYTATRNWFVSLTPSAPPDDPDIPDIPEGAIGISTIEELQLIGNDPAYPLDGYYVLLNDIDASATATWNAGAGFKPIGTGAAPFTGTLDGQGYGVTGLHINRPREKYVGLVGVNGGTVTGCYATGAVTGEGTVGGLVGSNSGTVTGCYATGTVTGVEGTVGGLVGGNSGTVTGCYATGTVTGDYAVGGLVGSNYSGTVTNCYATGTVTGTTGGAGGLVGGNYHGTVTNCYATGAVTGDYAVGGLVGSNYSGTVTNCYATGAVTGTTGGVGGLEGYNDYGTVTASYYDTQTTGQADNTGKGAPRTTAAMKQQATFVGWDFGVVWTIVENTDYPRLEWESEGT